LSDVSDFGKLRVALTIRAAEDDNELQGIYGRVIVFTGWFVDMSSRYRKQASSWHAGR
jgi:hypothetical protein